MSEERGLWIGLPVSGISESHPLARYLPADSHITLAHLGRTASAEKVEWVKHCFTPGFVLPEGLMEITGVGWFWRRLAPVPIALVNSAMLFQIRGEILGVLRSGNIVYDQYFGFIPHVTLRRDTPNDVVAGLAAAGLVKFVPEKIVLVWGDTEHVISTNPERSSVF